ncbi:hypothetical protein HZQ56_18225 [Elizabethkingia anophelis]|nr:hypothetical protein [Elizabethkingia anophelis]MCT3875113.1 hypothetical protein [Elizabethkingia anophelis]
MKNMSESRLIITIKNVNPIEITDFTNSFNALGEEYYKFLSESDNYRLSKTTKLYVKEIRSGSIITELTDLVPMVLPFLENTNSVIDFTSFLKKGYDYFLGKSKDKPKEFDLKDCNNFNNIIKPIAKDNGSQINFIGDVGFGDITINFNFNSQEANAIQNAISREKEDLKEPVSNIHTNVLFYWDSAKYDERSKSVDRGYIDSINTGALKVVFNDQDIKKEMLLSLDSNPFHNVYLVDVEVLTVMGIPNVYKILSLNQILPK